MKLEVKMKFPPDICTHVSYEKLGRTSCFPSKMIKGIRFVFIAKNFSILLFWFGNKDC